jgi:hypothetical protein
VNGYYYLRNEEIDVEEMNLLKSVKSADAISTTSRPRLASQRLLEPLIRADFR